MDTIEEKKIERLIEDISSIKSVLKKNRPLLKEIFNPASLRFLLLFYGLTAIVFPMLYYFLIQHFGSYTHIPDQIRTGLFAVLMIVILVLAFYKWRIRAVQKMGKMIITDRFAHMVIPTYIIMFFLCSMMVYKGQAYYVIPVISISTGILLNFYGCITEIKQYFLSGYWFLIVGVISILFTSISPLIYFAVSQSIGWFLLTLPIKEDWLLADINKIIHERARLLILSCLASNEHYEVSFTELLEKLELTSGNLSIQIKKLKQAGFVEIKKTFKDIINCYNFRYITIVR